MLATGDTYIETIYQGFDDPTRDCVIGPIYWGGYGPHGENLLHRQLMPELYVGDLYLQKVDRMIYEGNFGLRDLHTSGPNSALRLAAVCAAGGYDYQLSFREEVELGERIKIIRTGSQPTQFLIGDHFFFSPKAWVATSPRRAILAVLNRKVLVEQWDDFDDHIGSDLSIQELQTKYTLDSSLLQDEDLRGDSSIHIEKLSDRLVYVLLRSANNDHLERDFFLSVLRNLGLRDIRLSGASPPYTQLSFDTIQSPLIRTLKHWVQTEI